MRALKAIVMLIIIAFLNVSVFAQTNTQTLVCNVTHRDMRFVQVELSGIHKENTKPMGTTIPIDFTIKWLIYGSYNATVDYYFVASNWIPPENHGAIINYPHNDIGIPKDYETNHAYLTTSVSSGEGVSSYITYSFTCTIPSGTNPGKWTKIITLYATYDGGN